MDQFKTRARWVWLGMTMIFVFLHCRCIILKCACIPCYLCVLYIYHSALRSRFLFHELYCRHPPQLLETRCECGSRQPLGKWSSHSLPEPFLLPKDHLQTKLRNLNRLSKKEHSHGVFEISQNWGCKGVRVELVHICFCQGSWLRPWYWAPCTWPPPQCMKHLAGSGGRQAVSIDRNGMLYSIAGSASFEELITSND